MCYQKSVQGSSIGVFTMFLIGTQVYLERVIQKVKMKMSVWMSENIKYLGVVLHDKLNWKTHLKFLQVFRS